MTYCSRLSPIIGLLLLTTGLFSQSLAQVPDDFSVLLFSQTNGYRHKAIPDGVEAIQELSNKYGFEVEATEDSTVFRFDRLSAVDVIVFMNTSGDVLGTDGQEALRRFIQHGGGYVGVHAASDTEYDWAWYGRLVGAYFDGHPSIQTATVRVEKRDAPSTHMLPEAWNRRDEWYNFRSNPRDSVEVLLTLDESTYQGGSMGRDHPIAWRHQFDGGRAWYTAGGHTQAAYRDSLFRQHLLGGIRWAAMKLQSPDVN